MYKKIKCLIIFCIAKSGLILTTVVFFTFQCSDPLSFLLADTTLRVDKNKVLLYEGEADTIGFRLNAQPFNDEKFVTLTVSLECEGLSESERTSRAIIDRKTITWRMNNWATWQKFVIVAIENDKQEISKTCKLLFEPIQSNDVGFDKFKMKEIPITILDNDGDANIKVSTQNLALAEADSTNEVDSANVSYTIHLTNKPRDEVIINITHKDDLPSWFSPPELITYVTFTTENYNQPQTVTIAYPNDMYADGNFIHTLQHTITTIDPVYKEIAPINLPKVTLDLRDNDTLNFQTINNQDNALISSLEGKEGMTQSFKIKPSISLREGTIIKLDVVAANSDRIQLANSSSPYSVNPVRLTFKNNNPQIVNINFIDDPTTTESLFATTINYSVISSGSDLPIVDGISLSPQGGFASAGGSLTINIIEKTIPDLRVTNCYTGDSGINRLIEGGHITCNIQWDIALPSGDTVDVNIMGDTSLERSQTSLRFNHDDGTNAKSITISSIDDNIDQTNYTQTVTFSTAPTTGQAVDYVNKEKRVILNIIDDDTDSFSGSSSIPNQAVNVISSLREGDSGALKICLTADPKNSMDPAVNATVSFRLQSSNSNVLNIINPNFSLSERGCHRFNLTTSNNNIIGDARSVTLTISDFNNDGDSDYTLTQLFAMIGGNIIISIIDDDTPSVTISTSSLTILEGGSAQRYRIGLAQSALPVSSENVVIDLSTNHALLTVTPAQLTLNDINTSQSVMVTRVSNDIDEDDGLTGTISHTLNPSTGASYNIAGVQKAIRDANIAVTMNDNDTAGFIFTPTNHQMNVAEGELVYYAVQLRSKPTENVILEINPDLGLTGSATSLTFTPSNWSTPKTVVVQTRENSYVGDYDTQVNHGISSADSKYDSLAIAPVTIHVANNDGGVGNVIISNNVLAFDDTAGETGATYTISLSHNPASGKTVKVNIRSRNSDLEVSPDIVTFTDSIGRNQKVVTVTRVNSASDMIMMDITGVISHTIATSGSYDPDITTFQGNRMINVTVNSTASIVDFDHDGLIDINDAMMLNNMRYNLAGTSYKTSETPTNGSGNVKGCPTSGCNGYELTANIDLLSLLDANKNGYIDTKIIIQARVIDTDMGKDISWMPIGDNLTNDDRSRFTGIFEGNNHTLENLWVLGSVNAGLFGATGGIGAIIRNVGIISGSVSSSYYSGSLVGIAYASLTISNSYFSGSGGIFSSVVAGGLVGKTDSFLTITNSYFNGSNGVSSSAASASASGGLVGYSDTSINPLTIANSYFFGSGGVSSSSSAAAVSGGLVGRANSPVTITNSYFSGDSGIFSSSSSSSASAVSGGLMGYSSSASAVAATITNSYFSGVGQISSLATASTSSSAISGGLVGKVDSTSLTITNSYFGGSGGIYSDSSAVASSDSGALIGRISSSLTITKSYWNNGAPQKITNGMTDQDPKRAQGNSSSNPSGATGLTLAQLMGIMGTYPSGLPHSATDNTKAWDLGASDQLPAIKLCVPIITGTGFAATADWTMCASYGALLPRQR